MVSNGDQRNLRRGGCYWLDKAGKLPGGRPFISITNILKVIDKPALRYWYGEQIYLAMAKDPTLSKEEAMRAPYKSSSAARNRGTTVHSIVEVYKRDKVKFQDWYPTIDEEWQGYAKAFERWVNEKDVEILENERTVASPIHGYAGTLDIKVRIKGKVDVVDVKTGQDIYAESSMQVFASVHALRENGENIDGGRVVLLNPSGFFKEVLCEDEIKGFLGCRDIYISIYRKQLKTLGYFDFNER